jgi:benzil reductase ((S)-benzoin forming)
MTPALYIVTGSSRGMGAAIVEQLLRPGHTVIGIARQSNAALAAQAEARGVAFEQWQHDLVEPLAATRELASYLASQAATPWSRVVLVNNAGAVHPPSALRDADYGGLVTTLRVSLEATTLLCAAFLRATRGWPGQRLVLNISSGLGRRAMASSAAYCAAKAGMDHLSRCMALEESALANGARVVSLAPGVIDTDMQKQLRAANPADFPDHARFIALQRDGQLLSVDAAAQRVLAWLERPDFGAQPIADVRDAG